MRRLAVLLVVACGDPEEKAPETVREPDMPQASRPARSVEHRDDVCVLQARNTTDVLARFKSTVAELLVNLNDSVTKGQPVVRLDDRQAQEDLKLAKAALASRQAEVSTARSEQRTAKARALRERQAYEKGISAKAVLDEAEGAYATAGTAVARAVAAVGEQQTRIEFLKRNLSDTMLVAPEAGRIALIHRRAGEAVAEGAPVVRVISNDELFVKLALPPDHKLEDNDPVTLTLDRSIQAKAVVRRIAPSLDPVAQMYIAEADLVEPPQGLKGGMSCRFVPAK